MTDFPYCWYKFHSNHEYLDNPIEYRMFDDHGNHAAYIVDESMHGNIKFNDQFIINWLFSHLEYQRSKNRRGFPYR